MSGYARALEHRPARSVMPIALVGGLTMAAIAGLVTANQPVAAVAASALGFVGVAMMIRPNIATIAVAGVLYTNAAAVAVREHGLPFIMGAAFPLLLLIPLAYLLVMRRERLIAAPALPWILAFVFASTISTIVSSEPDVAASQLETYYLEGVVLFFLATNVMRSSKIVRSVIWTIVLAGALLALLSVYQQFTGDFGNQFGGFAQVSSTTEGFTVEDEGLTASSQKRLGGPFSGGGANRYAQILLVLVPLAVFLVWTAQRLRARLLAMVALLLLTFGVVLTFSRGAALAFAALVVLMGALRFLRLRHLALLGAVVAIVLVSVPSYWIRVSSLVELPGVTSTGSKADSSIQSRGTENLAAILIFADHPAFGVGPGLYPQYYEEYQDRVGDYSNVIDINQKYTTRQAHNLYLGVLAETGIVGFTCLMGAIGATLLGLWRARRRCLGAARPDLALLPTAVGLALAAYLITAVFLHLAYERYFFLLLALGAAAAAVTLRDLATGQEESAASVPRSAPAGHTASG